jgi:hypothetical protein
VPGAPTSSQRTFGQARNVAASSLVWAVLDPASRGWRGVPPQHPIGPVAHRDPHTTGALA